MGSLGSTGITQLPFGTESPRQFECYLFVSLSEVPTLYRNLETLREQYPDDWVTVAAMAPTFVPPATLGKG